MGPHESKIFQRSLSDRLPDRPAHDKLDTMFDQRFGFQNPLRDVNRFGDRSFEPFSPSRLHEMVRSFDFKEIEAKLFDPSLSSEKFQRMAENFNEFRSRFQDQMFRRDSTRQGGFPFDGRNVFQEMNDRNSFMNSRNDNIDFGSNRDRYENRGTGNFNGMGVNDIDNFGPNRNDPVRMRSRSEMGSRNNLNSPDYNRGRESVSDNLNMSMDAGQIDIPRNSLTMDQSLRGRNNSTNSEVMIPRSTDMTTTHENTLSGNQRQEQVLSTSDSDIMGMRQGQQNGIDNHNSLGGQGGMDQRGNIEQRNSLDQRSRLDTGNDAEMIALRGPRNGMEINVNSMRGMMPSQMERPDIQNNCNGMMSPNGNMILTGSRDDNTATPLNIVDRGSERQDRAFDNQMQSNDIQERSGNDFDMMDRNNMNMNQEKDKMHNAEDMVVDNNINIGAMERDNDTLQLQNHSRNMSMGSLCSDMDRNYAAKRDVHIRTREMMMQDVNVHDDLNPLSRSNSIPQQIGTHHSTQKQNGHNRVSLEEDDMDFCNRSDDKSSPTQNLSDPNMIRQRKQRKPSNPQHVFMPSLDHYTSFAVDEVEEVGALI